MSEISSCPTSSPFGLGYLSYLRSDVPPRWACEAVKEHPEKVLAAIQSRRIPHDERTWTLYLELSRTIPDSFAQWFSKSYSTFRSNEADRKNIQSLIEAIPDEVFSKIIRRAPEILDDSIAWRRFLSMDSAARLELSDVFASRFSSLVNRYDAVPILTSLTFAQRAHYQSLRVMSFSNSNPVPSQVMWFGSQEYGRMLLREALKTSRDDVFAASVKTALYLTTPEDFLDVVQRHENGAKRAIEALRSTSEEPYPISTVNTHPFQRAVSDFLERYSLSDSSGARLQSFGQDKEKFLSEWRQELGVWKDRTLTRLYDRISRLPLIPNDQSTNQALNRANLPPRK